GAEDEEHQRGRDQHLARLGLELAREAPEQEHDDRDRGAEDELLPVGHAAQAHRERRRDEHRAAAEHRPVGMRLLLAVYGQEVFNLNRRFTKATKASDISNLQDTAQDYAQDRD